MASDKSPAFQWYSKDILSSARVAMMTLEEEGAYRRALDFCWLNGSLPRDPEKLARLIGKGCSVEVANTVQQMFIIDKKNSEQILHERLEIERKKQREFRVKKSKAGTASGASRRRKNKLNPEQVFDSVQNVFEQNANKTRTKTNSSSSSSSSSPESSSPPPEVVQTTREESSATGDAVDDFSAKNPTRNSENGHLSKFDESVCREYVDAVKVPTGKIENAGGLAHSLYLKGNQDADIQAWIDSGKKPPAKKPKGRAAIL